ncbi:hypothetical protein V6N12_014582 [Hibiscus sabdariffa]|uniref:Uncharacterized protein n=1 Tax=Hibiscus sabdariffa TaxID=183260 RepID=A0ABR2DNI3_9ROSI
MPIFGGSGEDKANKTRIDINNTGTKRNINGGGGNSGITNGKIKTNIATTTMKMNDLLLNINRFNIYDMCI